MPATLRTSARPAIVAIAPAALLAALVAHPFLQGRLPNDVAVAGAVAADTTRWALVHLATGVASGLVILAFLAIRSHLRDVGEDRYSAVGLPFIAFGSTLFALLTGLEFAPLAAAETGAGLADIAAAQAALAPWFMALLATSAVTFGIGVLYIAKGIAASQMLSPRLTAVVTTALIIMAVSRALPFAVAQFYLQSAAGLAALWPLAHHLWTQARRQPAPRAGHPTPAT